MRNPAATTAPVWPALTTASASPAAMACQQRTMEQFGFSRSATVGFSSIPTKPSDSTIRIFGGKEPTLAISSSSRGRSPTSRTSRSGIRSTASKAPTMFGPGAKSPPIASRAIRMEVIPQRFQPAFGPGSSHTLGTQRVSEPSCRTVGTLPTDVV